MIPQIVTQLIDIISEITFFVEIFLKIKKKDDFLR